MREVRFYVCEKCGNLAGMIKTSKCVMKCCGEEMKLLEPNTVDAAFEKHVPVVTAEGNLVTVAVGSAAHPMTEEHYIQWVYLLTAQGGQRKELSPGAEPVAVFALSPGDEFIAAYAYCNLHGLWKS